MRLEAKKTLLAGAVATALGTAATVSVADEIMFPYVVGSATVTTILSVVNSAGSTPGAAGTPDVLHYTYLYKSGTGAGGVDDNNAVCAHTDFLRPTSKNDIVTFDAFRMFGDADGGVLFNDPSVNANYGGADFSGGLGGFIPIRSFLIVDNNRIQDGVTVPGRNPRDNTMYGEAMVFEFGSGAAFGYRAYNAVTNATTNIFRFDDRFERTSEVLAGRVADTNADGVMDVIGLARTPITVLPFNDAAEFTQKFLVTPIYNGQFVGEISGLASVGGDPGTFQNSGNIGVATRLVARGSTRIGQPLQATDAVMYNRDELPESGSRVVKKVCVGAIDTLELVDPISASRLPDGGWTHFQTQNYGGDAGGVSDGRFRSNAAVVMKLDYNKVQGSFNDESQTRTGASVGGVYNNAVWLRHNSRTVAFGLRADADIAEAIGPGPLVDEDEPAIPSAE